MATCDFGTHNDLDGFYDKLNQVLEGKDPDLTERERAWLRVFREVANHFEKMPLKDSFQLSYGALEDCYLKGKADHRSYLWKACWNDHDDAWKARQSRRKAEKEYVRRTRKHEAVDHRARLDLRIDTDDALERIDPLQARVMKLKLAGHSLAEIAHQLRTSKGKIERLVNKGNASLQPILEFYDEGRNHRVRPGHCPAHQDGAPDAASPSRTPSQAEGPR
jgi:hypothetical protein